MKRWTVTGAGGVELAGDEIGDPAALAIVFMHGLCQTRHHWVRQFDSALRDEFRLVRFDHRGHGESAKPDDPADYARSDVWAEDLRSVMDTLGIERAVICAWSYSGHVACDYVRRFGDQRLAGLMLVAAATDLATEAFFSMLAPSFAELVPGLLSDRADQAARALHRFTEICTDEPLADDDFHAKLGRSLAVPTAARRGMIEREVDNTDVLRSLRVPVVALHGRRDRVLLPEWSEFNAGHSGGRSIVYEDCGHTPFIERTERFNADLERFASSTT